MPGDTTNAPVIEGQLSSAERELLMQEILTAAKKPAVVIEVGTWLGGWSTLHILRALEKNGEGHLWGIEADQEIYARMMQNLRQAAPEALHRFTPLFGFSKHVIPQWLADKKQDFQIDLAFLDGGNNPMEQILEFRLIDPFMPVGSLLLAHDARMRKGKWLVPYVSALDNWESRVLDTSEVGLFHARKMRAESSEVSLTRANRRLWRNRLEPAEVAAALLPRQLCGLVLRLLPARISTRLAGGGGAQAAIH